MVKKSKFDKYQNDIKEIYLECGGNKLSPQIARDICEKYGVDLNNKVLK